jgi:hypothetical protein
MIKDVKPNKTEAIVQAHGGPTIVSEVYDQSVEMAAENLPLAKSRQCPAQRNSYLSGVVNGMKM